ncbi:polyprenyl synthetase [Streptomyces sp. B6B3]|uniref:polyprenyl synthetase n=1 Tax=Streptomyces sp. B6B3 TaxID=3153570 RepID=UPI00325CD557
MTRDARRGGGPEERVLLVAAGLADLALSAVGSAVATARGLLRRSDAAEVAGDAERDLSARGRLALDRYAGVPPAYLEVLARQALARRAPHGDAESDV